MPLSLVSSVLRFSNRLALLGERSPLIAMFSTSPELKEKIDKMVNSSKVVVFMKGNPGAPRCGFSNAVTQILRMHGVQYDAYDVLSDEDLRQGIKEYGKWPTIPQVYVDGGFVGGCDIMLELHKSGELINILEKVGIKSALANEPSK